jgi:aspartate aminotransferase-like enzyme
MMEAGARAVPRGRILGLVNGAFSARFARIAEACGHELERFEVDWGEVHDPGEVDRRVRDGGLSAVTVAHSETSTGALQDIGALATACGETPLLVDGISSVGGAPLDFDERGLAFACTASQKTLAIPPGLSFAVASERLLEGAARASARGLYLDLLHLGERTPAFTPCLPLLYALRYQARRLEVEGVGARIERHAAMARRTREWARSAGLEVLARDGHDSPTITCVRLPGAPAFVEALAQRGYTVGYGYGKLREETFRIGHMGDQTLETLEGLLKTCDAVLSDLR